MKIIDNFLPEDKFNKLKEGLENEYFPWYWNDHSLIHIEDNIPQFIHAFIAEGGINSDYFKLLIESDIFLKLNIHGLCKCKANLNYPTQTNVVGGFHTDLHEEDWEGITTSILYINTNNGGTRFEDGTTINSVANRVVSFDCSTKHAPVSCTDKLRRIVLNLNYSENKKHEHDD